MQKAKEEKIRKWPDYMLWAAALTLSGLACVLAWHWQIFPEDLLAAGAAALLGVDLVCLILIICRRHNRFGRWVLRLFLAVMCGVLAFGDVTLYNGYRTLETVTAPQETVYYIQMLVSADSEIKNLSGLDEKAVGYSPFMEANAAKAAMARIGASADGVEYVQEKDYADLYELLEKGEIDGMLIPKTRVSILKAKFPDLEKDTKVLYTFENHQRVQVSGSVLDISREPFVVYLGGMDDGDDPNEYGRCDVNILLMVDPASHHMTTVSIPRDSYVPNPALNNGGDKLTHLGNDGPDNSMEGLEEALGIEIDYYAKVNFQSLIHIVDALGGIKVDVKIDFKEQDENRSFKKKDLIVLEKGEQVLNGKQALAYARHRKTEGYGTTGREQAQQQIIKAIMKKLTTPEGIARINQLMNVAQNYVATNLPFASIQQFVSAQLEDVKPWTVDSITLKEGQDAYLATASMPSMPLSCYLLSEADLTRVFDAYASMFNTVKLDQFQFNLSKDPDLKIQYDVKRPVPECLVTAEDYPQLNSYTVYYGRP